NGNFYYWRADTRLRLNQYDQAIADFDQALDLMPEDRASLVGRGIARLWTEDWQAAIADVSPVIQAQAVPDQLTAWALRARGIARAGLGHAAAAVADYRAYLALSPNASDRRIVEAWIEEVNAGTGASTTGGDTSGR
ncbi:MAG: tetratricopeptide repeat protein, partial [Chloroflexota bacterium]